MIFGAALLLGFVNSLHCLGMCGPLHIAAMSRNNSYIHSLFYHFSRLSIYALLGLLFGTFGFGLYLAGIQQPLSIISGVLIILFVMVGMNKVEAILYKPFHFLLGNKLSGVYQQHPIPKIIMAGAINGLLPCGLVYMALLGSMVLQNAWQGALFMFLFGVGTLPVFILTTILPSFFKLRFNYQFIAKTFGIVLGIYLIIRGMGLGIPYVSPVIDQTIQTDSVCAPH
jgi:sulfite exporter TauE/SafE